MSHSFLLIIVSEYSLEKGDKFIYLEFISVSYLCIPLLPQKSFHHHPNYKSFITSSQIDFRSVQLNPLCLTVSKPQPQFLIPLTPPIQYSTPLPLTLPPNEHPSAQKALH